MDISSQDLKQLSVSHDLCGESPSDSVSESFKKTVTEYVAPVLGSRYLGSPVRSLVVGQVTYLLCPCSLVYKWGYYTYLNGL